MSGIAAIIDYAKIEPKVEDIKSLTDLLAHKGPDIQGGVTLGHRRITNSTYCVDPRIHFSLYRVVEYYFRVHNSIKFKNGITNVIPRKPMNEMPLNNRALITPHLNRNNAMIGRVINTSLWIFKFNITV